jgi:hypothetical protein
VRRQVKISFIRSWGVPSWIDSISGDETAPRRPRKRERERFQISVDARHFPAFFFDDDEERRQRRRREKLTCNRRSRDGRATSDDEGNSRVQSCVENKRARVISSVETVRACVKSRRRSREIGKYYRCAHCMSRVASTRGGPVHALSRLEKVAWMLLQRFARPTRTMYRTARATRCEAICFPGATYSVLEESKITAREITWYYDIVTIFFSPTDNILMRRKCTLSKLLKFGSGPAAAVPSTTQRAAL